MFRPRLFAYLPNYRTFSHKHAPLPPHNRVYNQQIVNNQTPICKDCFYFYPGTLPRHIQSALCLKYGEKNLITGEIVYNTAYINRLGVHKPPTCGQTGSGFSKKQEDDEFYGCP